MASGTGPSACVCPVSAAFNLPDLSGQMPEREVEELMSASRRGGEIYKMSPCQSLQPVLQKSTSQILPELVNM